MEKSESIGKLAEALAKAQGQIKGALQREVKFISKKGTQFSFSYADLASIWDACREPLSSNGLAVLQTLSNEGESVIIYSTLVHSSGEWVCSKLAISTEKDPQSLAAAVTYGRRITLSSLVGVAPTDEDLTPLQNRPEQQNQHPAPQSSQATKSEIKPDSNQEIIRLDKATKLREQIVSKVAEMHGGDVEAMSEFMKKLEIQGKSYSLDSLDTLDVSILASLLNAIMIPYNSRKRAA